MQIRKDKINNLFIHYFKMSFFKIMGFWGFGVKPVDYDKASNRRKITTICALVRA